MKMKNIYITLVSVELAKVLSVAFNYNIVDEAKKRGEKNPLVCADPLFCIPPELFGMKWKVESMDSFGCTIKDNKPISWSWSIPWMFIQRMEGEDNG